MPDDGPGTSGAVVVGQRKYLPVLLTLVVLVIVTTFSGVPLAARKIVHISYARLSGYGSRGTRKAVSSLDALVRHYDNVFMVVNTNRAELYHVLEHVHQLYSPIFGDRIVYYGPSASSGFPPVRKLDTKQWLMAYRAILAAIKEHPEARGIIYTNDDTALDVRRMGRLDLDRLWYNLTLMSDEYQFVDTTYEPPRNPGFPEKHRWAWAWHGAGISKAVGEFPERWTERLVRASEAHGNRNLSKPAVASACDFIYVPNNAFKDFEKGLRIMERFEVMLEIAVATVAVAVSEMTDWAPLEQKYLWVGHRTLVGDVIRRGDWDIIHPVKLSNASDREVLVDYLKGVELGRHGIL